MASKLRQDASPDRPGASAQAIEHHYGVSNAFFETWLDSALVYSCAMPQHHDDLETAQLAKLDYHLANCGSLGAARLLDVGCGWGAALSRAVSNHAVAHAVGLTLSPSQALYIEQRYSAMIDCGSVAVRVESWMDHEPPQPYDAILSVGAFEHFARPGVGRTAKVEGYRAFFERCHRWLRPGGRMALQTIAWGRANLETANSFIMNEIYPETDVPEPAEIFDSCKDFFEIVHLVADRQAYTWTLNEWRKRLRAQRKRALDLVDTATFERYERYLSLCAIAFHIGNLTLLRLILARL